MMLLISLCFSLKYLETVTNREDFKITLIRISEATFGSNSLQRKPLLYESLQDEDLHQFSSQLEDKTTYSCMEVVKSANWSIV